MKKYLLGLVLLLLTGCTSPLWWYDPEYTLLYKGVVGRVVDQSTVIEKCGILATGCVTIEPKKTLPGGVDIGFFSVNNPIALQHECAHIDGLWDSQIKGLSGNEAVAKEQMNDLIFNSILQLHTIGVAATLLFPAMSTCGDGTMVTWTKGVPTIHQRNWRDIWILHTLDEVNRGAPIYPLEK